MNKLIVAGVIALIAITAITLTGYSYLQQQETNQLNPESDSSPTPTPSPSETPTETASIPNPSVPEFTLKYVDYSYDIPPKTTSTTDPYTNETITTTIPGYRVENKTIQATINNNIGASYYNFRYKGHYENEWKYYPFSPSSSGYSLAGFYSVPYKASNSSYTVAALPSYFFKDIPERGQVDIQVQALFGDFRSSVSTVFAPQGIAYDFHFEGATSDWSATQTVTIS